MSSACGIKRSLSSSSQPVGKSSTTRAVVPITPVKCNSCQRVLVKQEDVPRVLIGPAKKVKLEFDTFIKQELPDDIPPSPLPRKPTPHLMVPPSPVPQKPDIRSMVPPNLKQRGGQKIIFEDACASTSKTEGSESNSSRPTSRSSSNFSCFDKSFKDMNMLKHSHNHNSYRGGYRGHGNYYRQHYFKKFNNTGFHNQPYRGNFHNKFNRKPNKFFNKNVNNNEPPNNFKNNEFRKSVSNVPISNVLKENVHITEIPDPVQQNLISSNKGSSQGYWRHLSYTERDASDCNNTSDSSFHEKCDPAMVPTVDANVTSPVLVNRLGPQKAIDTVNSSQEHTTSRLEIHESVIPLRSEAASPVPAQCDRNVAALLNDQIVDNCLDFDTDDCDDLEEAVIPVKALCSCCLHSSSEQKSEYADTSDIEILFNSCDIQICCEEGGLVSGRGNKTSNSRNAGRTVAIVNIDVDEDGDNVSHIKNISKHKSNNGRQSSILEYNVSDNEDDVLTLVEKSTIATNQLRDEDIEDVMDVGEDIILDDIRGNIDTGVNSVQINQLNGNNQEQEQCDDRENDALVIHDEIEEIGEEIFLSNMAEVGQDLYHSEAEEISSASMKKNEKQNICNEILETDETLQLQVVNEEASGIQKKKQNSSAQGEAFKGIQWVDLEDDENSDPGVENEIFDQETSSVQNVNGNNEPAVVQKVVSGVQVKRVKSQDALCNINNANIDYQELTKEENNGHEFNIELQNTKNGTLEVIEYRTEDHMLVTDSQSVDKLDIYAQETAELQTGAREIVVLENEVTAVKNNFQKNLDANEEQVMKKPKKISHEQDGMSDAKCVQDELNKNALFRNNNEEVSEKCITQKELTELAGVDILSSDNIAYDSFEKKDGSKICNIVDTMKSCESISALNSETTPAQFRQDESVEDLRTVLANDSKNIESDAAGEVSAPNKKKNTNYSGIDEVSCVLAESVEDKDIEEITVVTKSLDENATPLEPLYAEDYANPEITSAESANKTNASVSVRRRSRRFQQNVPSIHSDIICTDSDQQDINILNSGPCHNKGHSFTVTDKNIEECGSSTPVTHSRNRKSCESPGMTSSLRRRSGRRAKHDSEPVTQSKCLGVVEEKILVVDEVTVESKFRMKHLRRQPDLPGKCTYDKSTSGIVVNKFLPKKLQNVDSIKKVNVLEVESISVTPRRLTRRSTFNTPSNLAIATSRPEKEQSTLSGAGQDAQSRMRPSTSRQLASSKDSASVVIEHSVPTHNKDKSVSATVSELSSDYELDYEEELDDNDAGSDACMDDEVMCIDY